MQLSTFSIEPGAPCFGYSGFTVEDTGTSADVSYQFNFDETTSLLSLIGDLANANQLLNYQLILEVTDLSTGLLASTTNLNAFTVNWIDNCDDPLNSFVPTIAAPTWTQELGSGSHTYTVDMDNT